MTSATKSRKRVLSGMRPTGKLHLGNYVGALQNWVGMQEKYECFFEVADWHALTTDYADTSLVKESSIEAVTDWLAAGLDPEKSVIFIQSHVPTPSSAPNPFTISRSKETKMRNASSNASASPWGC